MWYPWHQKDSSVPDTYHLWSMIQPDTRKRGRHRKLISTDINFIKLLISEHPTIYLDEIQEQLLTRRSAQISISTLLGTLCHLHLLNKDVSGHALERNISSVLFFWIGWRIWWRTQTCWCSVTRLRRTSALLHEGGAGHCGGLDVSSESALYLGSGTRSCPFSHLTG